MKKLLLASLLALPIALSGCAATSQDDHGYRTSGMMVEDRALQNGIQDQLVRHDARFRDANIRIHSYNGIVLITGQVPSHELKDKVLEVATQARHARHVHNQLSVSANARSGDRARDTWNVARARTALMRYKLSNEDAVDPSRISIVSEMGDIFVMGIVTRSEADQVTRVLQGLDGISRIARVFDYLD